MSKAKELREKFNKDLLNLQNNCPHIETEWMPHMWAPGHLSPYKVRVYKECEATVEQAPPDGQYELMLQA